MSYFLGKLRTMHVYTKDNKMYVHGKKTHYTALCAFVWLALLVLSSCKTTTEYVEHEIIKHDSIYITAVSVDTIMERDSIHIVERGDTITQYIYKYVYKVKERTDTMFVERTDTITLMETKVETKTIRKPSKTMLAIAFLIGAFIPTSIFYYIKRSRR